jgi:endonuclease/exonuclease/phosphatase family metal-dependent hydrolase
MRQQRWTRGLVVVGLLSALGGPLLAQDADELRVMSFNVRLGVADDGANSWENRKSLLLRTVQEFDPDLLGTQEPWDFQVEYLLEQLPGLTYVGWPRQPDSENSEQCALFYRSARFEKRDSGQFWLSETPGVPGSKGWDAAYLRVVTWVELRDRRRPETRLFFFNTHFDNRGAEARLQSARMLSERLRELKPSDAWVVTGDFNCGENSPPYRELVGAEGLAVVDSYRAAHPTREEEEGTGHAFSGARSGPRIDWILHSTHFTTASASIDRRQEAGRFPSDHFPVTAVLRWSLPSLTFAAPHSYR